MNIYRVRVQTNGGATIIVDVTAQSQGEAHRKAEVINPGYKAKGSQCIGPARRP